jgi:hypothetical protein
VDDEPGAFYDASEAPLEMQRPFVVWETVAGAAATNWETASMVGGTGCTGWIAPTPSHSLCCTTIHYVVTTKRQFCGGGTRWDRSCPMVVRARPGGGGVAMGVSNQPVP